LSIIVALDAKSQFDALAIAEQLDPALCRLKVGKELFTHEGPIIVKALQDKGFDVFLDLKFHDIPNTTAQPNEHVKRLAQLTKDSGLDGVVCSAQEAKMLRETIGKDFALVTPGIRPEGSNADDQKRIVTPKQAVLDGSTHLVIGRPLTQSKNMRQTLKDILATL